MDQNVVQEAHKLLEKDGSFATRTEAYILYNYFDRDIYAMKKSSVCDDGKIIDKTTINVCFKLENIIKEWNAVMEFAHSIRVDEEASCGYLIYWLYGKVKDSKCDDSDIYWIYNKLSEPLENICFKDKKDKFGRKFVKLYDRNILKSKKELHDFVEYYKFIKVNVNKNITNKKVYCRYIEYIFDLYHKMNQDHNLKCTGLYEEINHFENTFKHENGELNSLKNICSDISQKLVLEVNNKISCPSEQEENAYKEKFKKKPAASADSQNFTEIESPKKTQEKIKLEDNISEKLSSLKIYEELNNANNIDFNNSYCKELEINDTKAKNICAHVVKNLKKMTELDYIKEHNEYCLHFVRWIYEEICKIPGIDWKNIYKNPDITKLFRVQFPINSKSPKYRCYYDFAGNINEWKEKADLLDYFQIFDK
ncbi:PIR Superfamily Protein, partial [Plasmodium ovale curtisi]